MEEYSSFIFSHIPKCGGTSFRKLIFDSALSSGLDKNEIYIPGYNGLKVDRNLVQLSFLQLKLFSKLNLKVAAMHVPYNVHHKYTSFGPNPLYFSLFREPFDRFLSHYYFFYYRQGADGCKGMHLCDLDPDKRRLLINNLSNIYASYILGDIKSGVYSDIGLLDQIYALLNSKNYRYGLLDNVKDSINLLSQFLPHWMRLENNLPHINSYNFSSTYEDYITDSLKDEFVFNNSLDIKIYDYVLKSLVV